MSRSRRSASPQLHCCRWPRCPAPAHRIPRPRPRKRRPPPNPPPSRPSRSRAGRSNAQLRVTGSLLADEQAEVSAEIAGRITATPVERGTRVAAGALLVQARRPKRPRPSSRRREANAGADRGAARSRARPHVRSEARAGSDERAGVARLGGGGVLAHPLAARSEGGLAERVRSAPHPGRSGAPAVPRSRSTPPNSPTARSKRRAPACRSRTRRWPTPRSGRRSPGSSPSARSASATTSPRARASRRWSASIRCASS